MSILPLEQRVTSLEAQAFRMSQQLAGTATQQSVDDLRAGIDARFDELETRVARIEGHLERIESEQQRQGRVLDAIAGHLGLDV